MGLEHRLHHFPARMSGRERQHVAIARSLANGPSVLLADEPTGNLDSENSALILELLLRLHQEKKVTLVMVTHDPSIARRASRTIQMKDGRITRMILWESALLGLLGDSVGVLIGLLGAKMLEKLPSVHGLLEPDLSIQLVVTSVILSVVVGVLSGLYPAWRSSLLTPSLALQG